MNTLQNLKNIIIIALPLLAALLAQRAMQFIDSVMMGWLGPTALAAGAIGTAIFVTILLFCMGTLTSAGVYIARAKGANDIPDIKSTVQHGYCLALLLSIPCMLIIWFGHLVLLKIGQDVIVVENTRALLHGMVWGFPGALLFLVLRECVSAFSKTLIIMMISFLSIPLTFAVNYVLMYGKYHFPELGIAGIGYGSAIGMWFMFLSVLCYSKYHPLLKSHITLTVFQFNPTKFKDMLSIGIPSGTLFLLEAGMFLATAVMMGYFGVFALAAHQIALQCANIAYTLPPALAIATTLQVSHALGAQKIEQAKSITLISFSIALFISAIIAMLFIFAPTFLVELFLENGTPHFEETLLLTTSFLRIAALFLCFDAIQSVMSGALRGLRDTFIPMLISIVCYWILGVGAAYYLSMHTILGAKGIWYGLTLGLSSVAILLLRRFFMILKRFHSMRSSLN
jgi:MATE family multidrug resistance protein